MPFLNTELKRVSSFLKSRYRINKREEMCKAKGIDKTVKFMYELAIHALNKKR